MVAKGGLCVNEVMDFDAAGIPPLEKQCTADSEDQLSVEDGFGLGFRV